MHKTLEQQTTRPPTATLRGQQRRFGHFRGEVNHERPREKRHEDGEENATGHVENDEKSRDAHGQGSR